MIKMDLTVDGVRIQVAEQDDGHFTVDAESARKLIERGTFNAVPLPGELDDIGARARAAFMAGAAYQACMTTAQQDQRQRDRRRRRDQRAKKECAL